MRKEREIKMRGVKKKRRKRKHKLIHTDKQTDIQTDRRTDGQMDRQKSFIDMRYYTEQYSKSNSIE